MRVLFYVEPLTERDTPTWKTTWIHFVDKMVTTLRREFSEAQFLCVVGDGLEDLAKATLRNCTMAVIHHTELVPRFGSSALAASMHWYKTPSKRSLNDMAKLLKDRLGAFKPDVCITFSSAPFIGTAFPEIPVLHFEYGLVSRQPFPETAYLDPLGMFNNSYPIRNRDILMKYSATNKEKELVRTFRNAYLPTISNKNPLSIIKPALEEFRSSVLVALQFSQFYAYDSHAEFPDQYDLIIQTLASVPDDIAVVAVEHPQYPILKETTINYLKSKHKNFVWFSQFRDVPSASQYLIEHVDLVITVSSSVGLQTMLWKKPLIVLGHSHLDLLADSHSLQDVVKVMQQPWPAYKENILAWYLGRYSIPFNLLFDDGVLVSRILKAQDCARAGDYAPYFKSPFAKIDEIAFVYSRDDEIAGLNETVAERDGRIDSQNQAVAERDAEAKELAAKLQAQEARAGDLAAQLATRDAALEAGKARIEEVKAKLAARERDIRELKASTSWRVTAPLRFVRQAPELTIAKLGPRLSKAARTIYHRAPVPLPLKMRIKEILFRRAAPLFRHDVAYQEWKRWRRRTVSDAIWSAPHHVDSVFVEATAAPRWGLGASAKRCILMVAHSVSEDLYGAERSLLDIIRSIDRDRYDVFCVFPRRVPSYFDLIAPYAKEIIVIDYHWWHWSRPPSEETVAKFTQVIESRRIDFVHVNTIMIIEPLLAARRVGVPCATHAREIITKDVHLCELLGADAKDVTRRIIDSTDYIIANSRATQSIFDKAARTVLIYNGIDVDLFDMPNEVRDGVIRVGMISSNLPKKGVRDFCELARLAAPVLPNVTFHLFGPENDYIRSFMQLQAAGQVPPSLHIEGYLDSPVECVRRVNILVNFSHFAESFGRTVVEAMAARRPVIVYDWGALPELVRHGETGFVVPYLGYDKALDHLHTLASDPAKIAAMGEAGRKHVCQAFTVDQLARRLNAFYSEALAEWPQRRVQPAKVRVRNAATSSAVAEDAGKPDTLVKVRAPRENTLNAKATQSTGGISRNMAIDVERKSEEARTKNIPSVTVVVPNYNYSQYLAERLGSIVAQTLSPMEIIFLDDASTDDSVEVAKSILERSSIPFTIIPNEGNIGTYRQWLKGLSLSKGDYVWIAEADDTCDPDFLRSLVGTLVDERMSIAYCQSRKIDENGVLISPDNLAHTTGVDPEKWRADYRELGVREVVDSLVFRNTIPSVSACLLKNEAVRGIESELATFRYCGDWLLYAHMLKGGNVAYVSKPLSAFRRHSGSVTRKQGKRLEYLREVVQVREFICKYFPIHPSQLPRMDHFLNRDYRVDGVSKNSTCSAVKASLDRVVERVALNRRIAFITTNNGSYDGGSEVLWRQTAEKVRELGHDVVVLIKEWRPRPRFFDEFEAAGIKLYFKESDGIASVISFQPDLVVISTGDQDEGIEYYKSLKKHNLRYVIVNQLTKEEKYWPIRHDCVDDVKAGYLGAERVFFTCKNNHQVMEDRLRCQISNWDIHYNPYHIEKDSVPAFTSVSDGVKLAVPGKILFIHKGQDLLVEVLKSEKWKRRNFVVNIYGEGADTARLEQMASDYGIDKIVFHGREADIASIWRDNHAIVMPSRMEGLPIMLVSAMISARVPIVTDIGGHAEVIEDGVSGFLASSPSVDALDDALERAFRRKHEWEAIGRCARHAILAYLPEDPVQHFVEQVLAVVNTYIAGRGVCLSNGGSGAEGGEMSVEAGVASDWDLSGQEIIFQRVNRTVDPGDSMCHGGNKRHYFECGASALAAIKEGLASCSVPHQEVSSILDYACGFGRVLRWLRTEFTSADILAMDVDEVALKSVRDNLGVRTRRADVSLSKPLNDCFDLIWMGSLITHLMEADSRRVLRYLAGHLNVGGMLAFTTHGPYVECRIRTGEKMYSLEAEEAKRLVSRYEQSRYGFGRYPKQQAYGISVSKASWVVEAVEASGLIPVYYKERGWVKHQDVFAAQKP